MKKPTKDALLKIAAAACIIALAADLLFIAVTANKNGTSSAAVSEASSSASSSGSDADSESAASVIKTPNLDREMTEEDTAFVSGLHTVQYKACGDQAEMLYRTLTLTGDALGEEQNYTIFDLEELVSLSFETEALYQQGLAAAVTYDLSGTGIEAESGTGTFNGLDFVKYMSLCGIDTSGGKQVYIKCMGTVTESVELSKLLDTDRCQAILAFSEDGVPLDDSTAVRGPAALIFSGEDGSTTVIQNIQKIILSSDPLCEDPEYGLHNRAPHDESADIAFTVNIYNSGSTEPDSTAVFTTAELERISLDNPQAVVSRYYGTIGNAKSMASMGIGGWLDYFRGIDLWWLLTTQAGLTGTEGSASFYSRDGELYTTVNNIHYLNTSERDTSEYYTMSRDQLRVYGCTPMIAFTKNGYPLLPKHDHEMAGYSAYNTLNASLEALGVSTEIGVIKNHNGPFVACLGNLDGYYGGYEVETGGDCTRIDIHLN